MDPETDPETDPKTASKHATKPQLIMTQERPRLCPEWTPKQTLKLIQKLPRNTQHQSGPTQKTVQNLTKYCPNHTTQTQLIMTAENLREAPIPPKSDPETDLKNSPKTRYTRADP
ncbi:hypothetical protein WMY93_024307 [Mugilogobius chulae]|uniref:Uncharacterized protein n=1 Tax=Mugilogobius chulae TaxID=88201 RepID=A0AAW0NAB7_9GOBI